MYIQPHVICWLAYNDQQFKYLFTSLIPFDLFIWDMLKNKFDLYIKQDTVQMLESDE
jgi:hypothetical protein